MTNHHDKFLKGIVDSEILKYVYRNNHEGKYSVVNNPNPGENDVMNNFKIVNDIMYCTLKLGIGELIIFEFILKLTELLNFEKHVTFPGPNDPKNTIFTFNNNLFTLTSQGPNLSVKILNTQIKVGFYKYVAQKIKQRLLSNANITNKYTDNDDGGIIIKVDQRVYKILEGLCSNYTRTSSLRLPIIHDSPLYTQEVMLSESYEYNIIINGDNFYVYVFPINSENNMQLREKINKTIRDEKEGSMLKQLVLSADTKLTSGNYFIASHIFEKAKKVVQESQKAGKNNKKQSYTRTTRKHTDEKGVTRTIFTKGSLEYVRVKKRKGNEFTYRKITNGV
jgi:hypothetical protein